VPIGSNNMTNGEHVDRRVTVRRKEDFFWLKRLADLTGEACLVVNRQLDIEYVDEKFFEILNVPTHKQGQLTQLRALTSIMAEQGYFGRGDPKVFEALVSDLLVNQRLKQATATQIISAVTPSGQHVDIRVSLGRDDSYLLMMRDSTKDELKKRALDTALQVGQSGYWHYNLHTKEFHVRADSLLAHYSNETSNKIKTCGFDDVLHPDDRKIAHAAMSKAVTTCAPTIAKVRIIGDDGIENWLKTHIMPNVDESGKVRSLTSFFTLVTQQVNIERDLRTAQSQTEAALKAKNEFLGRLSHEVRTPMNAVIGMADALVHNCKDESIRPQLTLIQTSAEQVMDLVDSTLEHTKLANAAVELNLRESSPSEVVESVCRKWKDRAADNQTELSFVIHPDVPKLMNLDDYRYEQCLSNLLSNAIKFTQGGKVKVVLAPNGKGVNRQLVLAVRDNGIGISKGAQSQIFLPFKQADNSISSRFGGTGLGLSIVKDLVTLMGGRITVNSEAGKGTLFAITIPMSPQVDAAVPVKIDTPVPVASSSPTAAPIATPVTPPENAQIKTEKAAPPPDPLSISAAQKPTEVSKDTLVDQFLHDEKSEDEPYSHLRVLIVDDNATNHIVVSSLLSRVVGEITTALNGQEALDQLKLKEFDLVLMDIHMPVMDGIETTLAIRSQVSTYQNVPIIALTADPQYQQARLCRNIGMNSSLGKPIKLAGLLQAFDEVLMDENGKIASAA
jgi:signal transduction histidine kinase/CheY-like chemotaxis protein